MMVYAVVGIFILFDIITGILNAISKGEMNSTNLRKGLFHKLAEIMATIGAGLFEYCVQYIDIGFELPVLKVVAAYIVLMEFVSVCENLAQMNPALKKLFAPYLEKLKGGNTEDGE